MACDTARDMMIWWQLTVPLSESAVIEHTKGTLLVFVSPLRVICSSTTVPEASPLCNSHRLLSLVVTDHTISLFSGTAVVKFDVPWIC